MQAKLFFFFLIILFSVPASSAANVSIEIFHSSGDEYYLSINGGVLKECPNRICNIELQNVTSSDISSKDAQKIAKLTAVELKSSGLLKSTDPINETSFRSVFNDVIEKSQASDRAWVERTWMPTAMQYQNCTLELEQKKGALNTLDAKLAGHDSIVETKDVTIYLLKNQVSTYQTLTIMLSIFLFFIISSKTEFVRALKERWGGR